jgi:hypothetical protein
MTEPLPGGIIVTDQRLAARFDDLRDRSLLERGWLDARDPACAGHTVWLARLT